MNAPRLSGEDVESQVILGDVQALGHVLGSPGQLSPPAAGAAPALRDIHCAGDCRAFVREYQRSTLLPYEIPLIQESHRRAARTEIREILRLDADPLHRHLTTELAAASRRVGRRHLEMMSPLRDERVIRRYLGEVEAGKARGWHTIVYGIYLAVYSLPLRQGLLSYAGQTQSGFILAAARRGRITEAEAAALIQEFAMELPRLIQGRTDLGSRPELLAV
jgi:urease accessory protein UreF